MLLIEYRINSTKMGVFLEYISSVRFSIQYSKYPFNCTSPFVSALGLIIENLSILVCLKEHFVPVNSSASPEICVYEVNTLHLQGGGAAFPFTKQVLLFPHPPAAPTKTERADVRKPNCILFSACGKTVHLDTKTSARVTLERVSAV